MNEWREIALSKTTKFIVDNRGKTVPTRPSGIPLIATNCISNKNLYPRYDNLRYISQEIYDNWFRSHPEPGDIILTLKGSQNGAVCIVPNPIDFAIAQDMVALRTNRDIIDPFFLFAALRSPDVQLQIKNLDVSGVIPHLKKSDFDKLLLPYPPKAIQIEIGNIYFNLCRKIDLLHRQNLTLEQMAETLFRQWFVEEAKEDWEEVTLYNAIELIGGGTPKTSIEDYWNGKIKWLSGGDIAANHKSVITTSEKTITGEGLNNSSAKFLPKYCTVISARGTVGKYCILSEPMAFSQSNYGIKPRFKECYFFTYLLINHSVEELKSAAYGSVFDTITTETFKGYIVKVPLESEIKSFEVAVTHYFQKILNNQNQINTLEKMRNGLLPKLMSGEVRVNFS